MKGTLLILDDEFMIRELLCSALEREGYTCFSAGTAEEAVNIISANAIDLLLLDIMMPGMSGVELLPRLKTSRPDTAIIMVTAVNDVDTALSCIKMGADDYIIKPFGLDRILITVGNSLEKRRLKIENRDYQYNLEKKVQEQTLQINMTMEQLHRSYDYTLCALVRALDAREKELGCHSERVMNYTLLLAQECGVEESEMPVIAKGTLLHDIGKIGISDNILLKGSELDSQEWMEMKKHPVVGYNILSGISSLKAASDFVLAHHERFDGSGYPYGLKGGSIPLSARIFSFTDTLDAMTSDRPYRKALPFEAVIEEIRTCSGTQFDPDIATKFLGISKKTWENAGEKTFL